MSLQESQQVKCGCPMFATSSRSTVRVQAWGGLSCCGVSVGVGEGEPQVDSPSQALTGSTGASHGARLPWELRCAGPARPTVLQGHSPGRARH